MTRFYIYFVEARFCDTVGIMRKGRLLAQQSPQILMTLYNNSISLESVVLQLCKEDEKENNKKYSSQPRGKRRSFKIKTSIGEYQEFGNVDVELCHYEQISNFEANNNNNAIEQKWRKSSLESNSHSNFSVISQQKDVNIIEALLKKTFLFQKKYWLAVLLQLFLPVIHLILFQTIVGTDPKYLKVALVSPDWNKINTGNTEDGLFDYCPSKTLNDSCFKNEMSSICAFLNQFEDTEFSWVRKLPIYWKNLKKILIYRFQPNQFPQLSPSFNTVMRSVLLSSHRILQFI